MMGKFVIIDIADEPLKHCVESAMQQCFPDIQISIDDFEGCDSAALLVTDKTEKAKSCSDHGNCVGNCLVLLPTGEAVPDFISKRNIITQPFRMGQLLDHVQKIVMNDSLVPEEDAVSWGVFTLNLHENALLNKETGQETRITEKERNILYLLYKEKGEVMDRQVLLDKVWGYVEGVETHTLETHIYRLRQKIETDPSTPTILLTEDNGYRLNLS